MTCGSVDDGKSTLIGRLLVETESVPSDTIEGARSIRRTGSTIAPGEIDFSLLTDGLEAEREQGITIDVAYRSMALPDGRRLIIADTPGHEQYTRNMVVAASRSEIALLLLDATRGVRTQTHRHLTICALMGIEKIIVAINKMDLVDNQEFTFSELASQVMDIGKRLGFLPTVIPIIALTGANVVSKSEDFGWYGGASVLESIQNWNGSQPDLDSSFLPVQLVSRTQDFRGVSGTVVGRGFSLGDEVRVLPTAQKGTIRKIYAGVKEVHHAGNGEAVTFEIFPEIDISRGQVLADVGSTAILSRNLVANLVWLGERDLAIGHSYLLQSGVMQSPVELRAVRNVIDVESGDFLQHREVAKNAIAEVELVLTFPLLFTNYRASREFGNFILIDRETLQTVAAGMVNETQTKSENVSRQNYEVTRSERSRLKGHQPHVIWLTGLSGSGKSTIADALEKSLSSDGVHTYVLDGDNLRLGLNQDLGFSREDRRENVRRVGEVAKLMMDAGLVVIVALVSPFAEDRTAVKSLFAVNEFSEVWVNTPVAVCQERDPKGLYKRATKGEISNLTGIGQEYEPPKEPALVLDGTMDLDSNIFLLRGLLLT